MFGRATITLGIGPHSSFFIFCLLLVLCRIDSLAARHPTLTGSQVHLRHCNCLQSSGCPSHWHTQDFILRDINLTQVIYLPGREHPVCTKKLCQLF